MTTENNENNVTTDSTTTEPNHKVERLPQYGYHSNAMKKASVSKDMLKPKFWGNWITIALLWTITWLPYPILMLMGRAIGRLAMLIARKRVKITRYNLHLAFPDMSEKDINKLVAQNFANFGMGIFETAMAWYWPNWRFKRLIHIDEEEKKNALELASSNKGIIVLTCHFVTLELMARAYGTFIKPGVGVYRPNDNKVLEYMQVKGRTKANLYLVDRKDVRTIVKSLMKGYPIWYAPDQDYGKHLPHVFAPFFAVPNACTVTGTANLARIKNTVTQPSYLTRLSWFRGYQLHIEPILENFPNKDADDYENAVTINKVLEKIISAHNDHYMWLHKRFKTMPEGMPHRYENIDYYE